MFKPCTTKTSIINRSFDEMGNLLWQQEAAEFVERYPQRRRPQTAALLLRQSASAGTLYRKPCENVMPILNKRASGGELLTSQHRHQRDLFSGDLGIPDVNSHVGSMVHTFENMAMQRQMAERQRDQREREHSKYIEELLALQAAAQAQAAIVATTTTTTKRTFIPSSGTHNSNSKSNSKFQQLKKKTLETRQKIIQQILQQQQQRQQQQQLQPELKNLTKNSCTVKHLKGARPASSNSEVYYRNIEEDYRKNLFGTLNVRKIKPEPKAAIYVEGNSDLESTSFCDEVVTQAFDEIFEGYSGLDDEEEDAINTDNLVTECVTTSHTDFLNQYARPGLTPKKLPPLIQNKKNPAPQPPANELIRRKIMPLNSVKQKSSTLHNLFERLKTPPKSSLKLYKKTSSDTLLKTKNIPPSSNKQLLHKFPGHLHLNREIEGQEDNTEKLDQDFLRGSTVSQSFVKHLKLHKPSKGKAPPAPNESLNTQKPLKTSEALRQVLLFSKRSKTNAELLPDHGSTAVEARKYYRRLEEDFKMEPCPQVRRKADGCSIVDNKQVIQQQMEI